MLGNRPTLAFPGMGSDNSSFFSLFGPAFLYNKHLVTAASLLHLAPPIVRVVLPTSSGVPISDPETVLLPALFGTYEPPLPLLEENLPYDLSNQRDIAHGAIIKLKLNIVGVNSVMRHSYHTGGAVH